jgi:hypothetical protein
MRQTRLEAWIAAWIDIACGIVTIVTFTAYMPSWYFDFMGWCINRRKNERK